MQKFLHKQIGRSRFGIGFLLMLFMVSCYYSCKPLPVAAEPVKFKLSLGKSLSSPIVLSSVAPYTPHNSFHIDFDLSNKAEDFQTSVFYVDVPTNNETGYTLTMSTPNTNLINHYGSSTIYDLPTLSPKEGGTAYTIEDFTMNTWGYSLDNGVSFLPISTADVEVGYTTAPSSQSISTITLGARANSSLRPGDYQGEIVFSSVANIIPDI